MLPDRFVEILEDSLGPERAQCVLMHLDDEPSISVRANPAKIDVVKLRDYFASKADIPVEWCPYGFYLNEKPSFTLDPLFHAGAYYVQEASSMYVASLLKPYVQIRESRPCDRVSVPQSCDRVSVPRPCDGTPLRVLDLCAAPGGKSTGLLSVIGRDALLVSNEVISSRATVLADNIVRWGAPNVCVTNCDPARFSSMESYFDVAVIDAPCSGEGMFRKDESAVKQWSPDNVNLCVSRQRRIVSDVWRAIRPGGYVVYSTCTFNRFEDEDNTRWICAALGARLIEERHFLPGEDRGEGFYCALLQKDGDSPCRSVKGKMVPVTSPAQRYITEGYTLVQKGELLKAWPYSLVKDMAYVESSLKCIRSGVAVASVKGKDVVPEADLALSTIFRLDSLPEVPLSKSDALKYLAREPLSFSDYPKGYLYVTYEGLPLGFVKNLGNRTNTLHPISRRIRCSIDQ